MAGEEPSHRSVSARHVSFRDLTLLFGDKKEIRPVKTTRITWRFGIVVTHCMVLINEVNLR